MGKIAVGIIGSGFVADIHAQAFKTVSDADVLAVASRTRGGAERFAREHNIDKAYDDYRKLLEDKRIEVVDLCVPNYLHAVICREAAEAGKHVICEKPLCMNLKEAEEMIGACRKAGVKLMYAENLCFTPKYVRAKQLVDEGALGKVYMVKQSEKHFGPHSDWFWDIERSGGGVLLDMGCHGIEFARWILGKPKARSVWCQVNTLVHGGRTRGDDNAICVVEFENDALALIEVSWARRGGMDDRAEIYGSEGVTYADLLHGSSLETYSEVGYGYAVEKASTTRGWTFTMYEEIWNYGYPQELSHFISCVKEDKTPLETGEDGRAVMEIILAAYASGGSGRKTSLPFQTEVRRPIDLWLTAR